MNTSAQHSRGFTINKIIIDSKVCRDWGKMKTLSVENLWLVLSIEKYFEKVLMRQNFVKTWFNVATWRRLVKVWLSGML